MIKAHVPSLDLCKKLKKAGYPQEGEFWWIVDVATPYIVFNDVKNNTKYLHYKEFCVAPLASEIMERLPASEIMERLPDSITKDIMTFGLQINKQNINQYAVGWCNCVYGKYLNEEICFNKSLCNALAEMYLYLAEQGLLGGAKCKSEG